VNPAEFVDEFMIRSLVCCFSGGRDSLTATHYTLSALEGVGGIESRVVFVDTTVSLPGVRDYVEETCRRLGWPLTVLHPKQSFWTLVEKKGMPRMRKRWCCYFLKLQPLYDYIKRLEHPRAFVTGLRREESRRRRDFTQWFWHKQGRFFNYAPIISWTKRDVNAYIRRHNLPVNPIYRLIDSSGECICGVYTSKRALKIIRGRFPKFFRRFVELEAGLKFGRSAFWKSGKPLRARDLWAQQTLDRHTRAMGAESMEDKAD